MHRLDFLVSSRIAGSVKPRRKEIVVPNRVAEEIRRRGPDDLTVQAIEKTTWLTIVESPPIPDTLPGVGSWRGRDFSFSVGPRQSWNSSHHRRSCLPVDAPRLYGIPVRGTLGLILTAKKRGVIPKARPVLEKLRQSGMYLSDRILNQALALIGE